MNKSRGFWGASTGTVAALLMASAAHAQMATSGIHGDAAPNAEVVARNVDSGFTTTDTADAEGEFRLQGLQPGTYDVTVTAAGETVTQRVRVLVGQTSFLALGPAEEGEIVVTGRRLDDPTTSEVGTNVTREQIEGLPQITRNFVNFAGLAPGVRTNQESTGEVTFSALGQTPNSVNVFIDGQSQKAQIIDGGIAGQDDSRGNPFPQLGIQEFRVLTQNFSAEYDSAGSAIVTSVTRSGTNDFEAEAFVTYQPTEWIEYRRLGGNTAPEPETQREQYGFAVGGPIMRDQLHYFFTYEGRRDDKFENVTLGVDGYEDRFGQFEGTVAIPFEEDIYFGKLSMQPSNNQRLDLSVTYRDETNLRDVGGVNAEERATFLAFTDTKVNLRHDWQGDAGWSNIAQIDYLETNYQNTAVNFTDFGQGFFQFQDADDGVAGFQFNIDRRRDVINLGGRGSRQDITQSTWSLRDDFSLPAIEWGGEHNVQVGARIAYNNYDIIKDLDRNPFFFFDVDARPEIIGTSDIPLRVEIKSPVPDQNIDNTTFGVYVQDDWQITDRLEVNLGLRWDYEDNAYNNDYRTPQEVRDLLAVYDATPGSIVFNSEDYIADGDREAFTGAWQPRIGFSYDISAAGDESTVIFGGAGRYYDRIPYNFVYEEESSLSEFIVRLNFSLDGSIPGTVVWNDAFFTPEGLQPLIDANPGVREVFLVADEIEPPVTDQFNFGLRHMIGDWRTSITVSHARTENTFAWNIGNLGAPPDGRFSGTFPRNIGFPQFSDLIFYSNHNGHREFNALYLTADRPFTEESGWGVTFAYTLSHATQNGSNDQGAGAFLFDFRSTDESPDYDSPNDEQHRIVASGIVAMPWDTRLSGILTLGSGKPLFQFDPTQANGARQNDAFPFQQLDLRLSKEFDFGDHGVELFLDVINATNHGNATAFEQSAINPNFGEPTSQIVQGRSFQVARARAGRSPRRGAALSPPRPLAFLRKVFAMRRRSFTLGAGAALALSACAPGGRVDATPESAPDRDDPFIAELQERTFRWFWEQTPHDNGLTPDRWPTPSFSSIAAVGFALTAYGVGVERGWVTRAQALERTRNTLRFFHTAPQGEASSGHRGFFYHFLDMQTGARFRQIELSSIDTTLLLGGVLFAQSYFDRDDAAEAEIRSLAEDIYARVEWTWMRPRAPLVSMGWHPEAGRGFIEHDWDQYNEAALLYVLALGSPTHALPDNAWEAWTSRFERQWGARWGEPHLQFAPLFGHQYSHLWIDFRGIRDRFMASKGIDYFENSRRATYAQQAYAVTNPGAFRDYSANVFGLTACDGPGDFEREIDGRRRAFFSYSARGPGARDDGTLAPTALGGSIPFAPEIAIPALAEIARRYGGTVYTRYGFLDSFNPTLDDPVQPVQHGRIVEGVGWVDGDYLGVDQGPIVCMIENWRSGLIWNVMRRNAHLRRGLERAGFSGGWLEG